MDLENITKTKQELIDFEKEIVRLLRDEKINGPVHFSSGNEEQIIKVFRGLRGEDYILASEIKNYSRERIIREKLIVVSDQVKSDDLIFRGVQENDWVCASYRSHYHALLKGISREWLREQIIRGASMYPLNKEYRFITSAIVPGQLPIALGIAKAMKLKNFPNYVWAFCGDMAAETGVFHEVSKYAENHNLPIRFIIEDNGLSVDTPTEEVWRGYDFRLNKNTIRYPYKSGVPHQGIGKEVGF